MPVKTTLGKVFETWKRNNGGTDEQLMDQLGATPAQYREMLAEVLTTGAVGMIGGQGGPGPYPTRQALRAIANRRGISTAGLTAIVESV
jgi:hypothetical protein